jgi:hypothetical protein
MLLSAAEKFLATDHFNASIPAQTLERHAIAFAEDADRVDSADA